MIANCKAYILASPNPAPPSLPLGASVPAAGAGAAAPGPSSAAAASSAAASSASTAAANAGKVALWSKDIAPLLARLEDCLKLNEAYQEVCNLPVGPTLVLITCILDRTFGLQKSLLRVPLMLANLFLRSQRSLVGLTCFAAV
jgi:hypothetical protein